MADYTELRYRLVEMTDQDGNYFYHVIVEEFYELARPYNHRMIDVGIAKIGIMSNGKLYFVSDTKE